METAEAEIALCALGESLNWKPVGDSGETFRAVFGEDAYMVVNFYQPQYQHPTPFLPLFLFNGGDEDAEGGPIDHSPNEFATIAEAQEACYHHSQKGYWA